MTLEISPARPIARLVVTAVAGHEPADRPHRHGPYSPPMTKPGEMTGVPGESEVELCTQLLHALLGDRDLVGLEDELRHDVVVWTPAAYAGNRSAAMSLLRPADRTSGPLTEVSITTTSVDLVPPRAYVAWHLVGRFTHPCFVEDDLLVEPTGRLVETAGLLVVTFRGHKVAAMHCYYDDMAVLEQLLEPA